MRQQFLFLYTSAIKGFQSKLLWVLGMVTLIIGCRSFHPLQTKHYGYIPIFDGKTLNGWDGDTTYWHVSNGELVGEVTPATLLKRNSFIIWRGGITKDFDLRVDYWVSDQGNSGINYRSDEVPGISHALRGYQADLDGQNLYTGSNYEERKRTTLASRGQKVILNPVAGDTLQKYIRRNFWTALTTMGPLGNMDSLKMSIHNNTWNEYHLIVKGNHLLHYVNNVLMSEVTDNDLQNRKLSGLLGVQVHVGPPMMIRYRNFRMKVL